MALSALPVAGIARLYGVWAGSPASAALALLAATGTPATGCYPGPKSPFSETGLPKSVFLLLVSSDFMYFQTQLIQYLNDTPMSTFDS